ncbi:MAG: hypothetical protein HZA50_11775 [Planctomycetes bacterium]|nr:hypothetical protein [Planctomycetota bacterium]
MSTRLWLLKYRKTVHRESTWPLPFPTRDSALEFAATYGWNMARAVRFYRWTPLYRNPEALASRRQRRPAPRQAVLPGLF